MVFQMFREVQQVQEIARAILADRSAKMRHCSKHQRFDGTGIAYGFVDFVEALVYKLRVHYVLI